MGVGCCNSWGQVGVPGGRGTSGQAIPAPLLRLPVFLSLAQTGFPGSGDEAQGGHI